MSVCCAKGHLVILSTMIGTLGLSPLDAEWSVPWWCLDGLSLWSFLESGVALGLTETQAYFLVGLYGAYHGNNVNNVAKLV